MTVALRRGTCGFAAHLPSLLGRLQLVRSIWPALLKGDDEIVFVSFWQLPVARRLRRSRRQAIDPDAE